jgi:hypothetical protein
LWLQQNSYPASVDRRLFASLWPTPATQGLAVSPSSAMTLAIATGAVAIPTANNTGSCLGVSDAVENVTVGAAPASNSRIDLVVATARGNDLDGGANNDLIFQVVAGTASATPVAPATPANSVVLAQVLVASGTAAITAGMITDRRPHSLQAASPYRVKAYQSSNQSLPSSTPTVVTWNATEWDTSGPPSDINLATGVWTCPAGGAGWYRVSANVLLSMSPATVIQAYASVNKNGAEYRRGTQQVMPVSSNVNPCLVAVADVRVAVGDTLSISAFAAMACSTFAGQQFTSLEISRLALE